MVFLEEGVEELTSCAACGTEEYYVHFDAVKMISRLDGSRSGRR